MLHINIGFYFFSLEYYMKQMRLPTQKIQVILIHLVKLELQIM